MVGINFPLSCIVCRYLLIKSGVYGMNVILLVFLTIVHISKPTRNCHIKTQLRQDHAHHEHIISIQGYWHPSSSTTRKVFMVVPFAVVIIIQPCRQAYSLLRPFFETSWINFCNIIDDIFFNYSSRFQTLQNVYIKQVLHLSLKRFDS